MHRRHYDQIVHNRDGSNEPMNTGRTDTTAPITEQVHIEVIGNNSEFIADTTTEQKLERQEIRLL